MDKSKIPWVECVIVLPEQIEENFNKLISVYKKKSRSKKKLKKKLNRLTTEKLLEFSNNPNKNLLEFSPSPNTIIPMSDEDMFSELALLVSEPDKLPAKLENKIIDYIDFIIKKYMNIYIHSEDQTFLISEKNKENNKIFLKFYFPRFRKSSR